MRTTTEPVHPRAYRWRVMRCGGPECRHPHLVFLDEDDAIIADAVIDRDRIDELAEALQLAVREIDNQRGSDANPQ